MSEPANETFFMVLADRAPVPSWAGGLPIVRHTTIDLARTEAKRLAGLNPGIKFFVLASLGHMVRNEPVVWEKHEFDEIPF